MCWIILAFFNRWLGMFEMFLFAVSQFLTFEKHLSRLSPSPSFNLDWFGALVIALQTKTSRSESSLDRPVTMRFLGAFYTWINCRQCGQDLALV